jgi:hypothetical protein
MGHMLAVLTYLLLTAVTFAQAQDVRPGDHVRLI